MWPLLDGEGSRLIEGNQSDHKLLPSQRDGDRRNRGSRPAILQTTRSRKIGRTGEVILSCPCVEAKGTFVNVLLDGAVDFSRCFRSTATFCSNTMAGNAILAA